MRTRNVGVAAIFALASMAGGAAVAPLALADTCDPAVTVCQGGDVAPSDSASSGNEFSPQTTASDDQYPFDGDWYFNPAGGSTELQPSHPSGGGGGGGGHH